MNTKTVFHFNINSSCCSHHQKNLMKMYSFECTGTGVLCKAKNSALLMIISQLV